MSTTWPWSSRACAISDTKIKCKGKAIFAHLALALFICVSFNPASASIIQAGADIQTAINSANAGDTIVAGPGEVSRFEVDRPLTIEGQGGPILTAALQKPAIIVNSYGVTITGLCIRGVGKDESAKFNYYMQNPAAAAGGRFDDPNSAIVVRGDGISIKNCSIFGAQVAISAENVRDLVLQNMTMDGCDTGASILQSAQVKVTACRIINCKKYGLDIERSRDVVLDNNSIVNNTNAGILLKETNEGIIQDNILSMNTFGLSLWNASYNQVRRNRADHNYYGILVTASSNYNNITENVAEDNSRSEIVKGFGIGISLQENSSNNLLIRNTARGNFNGLELSRGCKFNAVYDNNASDNKHGIRLNENRNNLIFGNNFFHNDINAYENTSLNIWNTTIGNYYNDYRGKDENNDGIGDQPYSLPGPQSHSFDFRPLIRPYREAEMDSASLRTEVKKYAVYGPADEEFPSTRIQNGVVVISRKASSSPPQWSDSRAFDASAPPFQKENDF
ncbi:MAG: right-handed parallel beta-helix repeat-containing protein [Methanothrix sp.]|nr:right-handed parallel beta-helix repeat-containing protein [Methanothrix sp.]